jgi:hypothetical protein
VGTGGRTLGDASEAVPPLTGMMRIRLASVLGRFAVMLAAAVAFGCSSEGTVGAHRTAAGGSGGQGAGAAAGGDGAAGGSDDMGRPRCGAALTHKANPPGHVPRFAEPVENPFGLSRGFLDFADMDGDGDLDLVEFERPPHRLVLRRNHGTRREPAFDMDTELLRDPGPGGAVRLADLDGDCDIDIYSADFYWSSLFILNAGDAENPVLSGDFEMVENSANTIPAELADFDGDGDVDLLSVKVMAFGSVTAFTYRENVGSSPSPVFSYALEEQCQTNPSCSNPACRPFGLPCLDGHGYPSDFQAADLDGDGDLDLLVRPVWSSPLLEFILYENVGNRLAPQFAPGRARPYDLDWTDGGLSLVDIDADGDLDFFISGPSSDGQGSSIYFYEDIGP